MLIKTITNGENSHTLICEACGAPLDTVDGKTLSDLLMAGQPVYCFDCDSVQADQIPEQLLLSESTYDLWIAGKWYRINWVAQAKIQARRAEFWEQQADQAHRAWLDTFRH